MAPRLITKAEASERLAEEHREGCIVCALRDGRAGPRYALDATPRTTVLLSRYPRRWGHVLVLVNAHVTSFTEVSTEAWLEASAQSLRAARAVERALAPVRCYVASLGTAKSEIAMSSPHLHLHVVPTYDEADRPKTVFDAERGLYAADEEEWRELHARLTGAWASIQGATFPYTHPAK